MDDGGRMGRHEWLFAAGIAAMVVAVRLVPWGKVFLAGGDVLFYQPDAYYHLRRVLLILRNAPHLPGTDPFMAYPFGAECPWPPLYDLAAGGIAWVAGLGAPSIRTVQAVVALLPPILAGLTVFPLYAVARRLGGVGAAAGAAVAYAVVPGSLGASLVGSGDHHAAETLLMALLAALFLAAADGTRSSARLVRRSLPPALALALAVLVWQGAVVFAAVLAGGILLQAIAARATSDGPQGERARQSALTAAAALAAAGAFTALARLIYPSDTDQTVFDFGFFSWFQPLLLVFLAAVVAPVATSGGDGTPGRGRQRSLAAAAPAALLAALALLVPGVRENLAGGFRFITTESDFLRAIQEFQPTWSPDTLWGRDAWSVGGVAYMLWFFLVPPFAAAAFVSRSRKGGAGAGPALFASWTALFFLLALLQRRWVNGYSLNMAVGAGWAAASLTALAPGLRVALSRHLAPTALRSAALALAAAAAGVALFYTAVAGAAFALPRDLSPDLRESLTWLRRNTPPPADPYDLRSRPAYGILAFWDLGHWIQWYGERPTVANNFGYQLRGGGLEDSLRGLLATSEEGLEEVCRRRGVRYLVLTDLFSRETVSPVSRFVGIDFLNRYAMEVRDPSGNYRVPRDTYFALPSVRLFLFDGSATRSGAGMGRFRLVHESPSPLPAYAEFVPGAREVKIFEFVRGATVTGRAGPGEKVTLSAHLMAPGGRTFTYRTVTVAGADGSFAAPFPYATLGPNGGVAPQGPASAEWAGGTAAFDLREEDILLGGRVDLRHLIIPRRTAGR